MPLSRTATGRLCLWLLAALLACLVLVAPAMAQNSATAVNEQDGTTQVDISFEVHKILNGMASQTNTAEAYASCDACQAIAIAFQVVLVSGDVAGVAVPQNYAVAINEQCTACLAFAWAYQFVMAPGERLRFTGDAQRRLAALARAFRELERSGASGTEVILEARRLFLELRDVLSTGIEPVGRPDRGPTEDPPPPSGESQEDEAVPEGTPDSGGEDPTPSPGDSEPVTPPATATPTPEATATPDATPTPEASTSVVPSPTASPSPSATP